MTLHSDLVDSKAKALLEANSPENRTKYSKQLLVALWMALDPWERKVFLGRVQWDEDYQYVQPPSIGKTLPKDEVLDAELVRVLKNWPAVLTGLEGAELDFANDVEKRRHWKNWKPSEKQIEWIMAIYAGHIEDVADPEMAEMEMTE